MDQTLRATRSCLAEALALHRAGELAAAEPLYLAVLAAGYRRGDVLGLLAGLALEDGRHELALARWSEAAALRPEASAPAAGRAGLLLRLGRYEEAAEAYRRAAALSPGDPLLLANLGTALFRLGRAAEAATALREALQARPGDVLLEHRWRRAAAASAPHWHVPMMNDAPRNAAFEAAIRRAVAERGPDALVLDIGAGSGLLAMMAARAGARRVVSCEIEPPLAEAAREIVARNGYADRVRIVEAASFDLQIGRDLPERASILVSEILSSDILAEGVLPSFEDARARLLTPDAVIIPRGVTAIGRLVGGAALEAQAFIAEASGFDLHAFQALAPNRLAVYGRDPEWVPLSAPFELLRLDLSQEEAHRAFAEARAVTASAPGRAVGVLQWMEIDLDAATRFSTSPEGPQSRGWAQIVHTFPAPIELRAGEVVRLLLGHDRDSLVARPA